MIDRDTHDALTRIDPSGWETREPTEADYAAFERRVTEDYGAHVLRSYYRTPLSGVYETYYV